MRSIVLILMLLAFEASSQSVERYSVGTSGGENSISIGSISYSLGGLTVSTSSSSSMVLTQEFEQPNEKSTFNFDIPNAFSPDNDGVNDVWEFNIPENITDLKVTVFNRWGDLMCEVDDYISGTMIWNGQLENTGAKSTDGTYFYVIESVSSGITLSGWLQLTR